jgi:hypothetical protein
VSSSHSQSAERHHMTRNKPSPSGGRWIWPAWGAAFLGFPIGGVVATPLLGPVESVGAALIAGAVAGGVIGAAQWLVLCRRVDAMVGGGPSRCPVPPVDRRRVIAAHTVVLRLTCRGTDTGGLPERLPCYRQAVRVWRDVHLAPARRQASRTVAGSRLGPAHAAAWLPGPITSSYA